MRCNRSSTKCCHNYYSRESMPTCCKQHLIQILHYLVELFNEQKIHYWMHFGTLLGAVRENGKMIAWDSDCDLGIICNNKQRFYALRDRIEKDGYSWSLNYDSLVQIGFSKNNWTWCDVWLYEITEARDHIVHQATNLTLDIPLDERINSNTPILRCEAPWLQVNHTADFPYWFVQKVEQIEFEGIPLNVPRHPQKFIEFLYGPDWQTPKDKDQTGYGGNYYPLSHWLNYIHDDQKKYLLKHQKSPYCRYDTKNCTVPNVCCDWHKADMMHMVSDFFNNSQIDYFVSYQEGHFTIKMKHYEEITKQSEKWGDFYDVERLPKKINIFTSKTNRNKITIRFGKHQ